MPIIITDREETCLLQWLDEALGSVNDPGHSGRSPLVFDCVTRRVLALISGSCLIAFPSSQPRLQAD